MIVATLDLVFFLTDVSLWAVIPSSTTTDSSHLRLAHWNVSPAPLIIIVRLTQNLNRHLLFNFPLCKLYTNSLMSSLNSRKGWNFSMGSGDQKTTVGDAETGQIASTQVNLQSHASYRPPLVKTVSSLHPLIVCALP